MNSENGASSQSPTQFPSAAVDTGPQAERASGTSSSVEESAPSADRVDNRERQLNLLLREREAQLMPQQELFRTRAGPASAPATAALPAIAIPTAPTPAAAAERTCADADTETQGSSGTPSANSPVGTPPSPHDPRPYSEPASQRRGVKYRSAGQNILQGLRRTGRLLRGRKRRTDAGGGMRMGESGDRADAHVRILAAERGGVPVGSTSPGVGPGGQTSIPHSATGVPGGEGAYGGRSPPDVDVTDPIVRTMEATLRHLVLVVGAVQIGAAFPNLAPTAARALEMGGAAWATCAAILALAWNNQQRGGANEVEDDYEDAGWENHWIRAIGIETAESAGAAFSFSVPCGEACVDENEIDVVVEDDLRGRSIDASSDHDSSLSPSRPTERAKERTLHVVRSGAAMPHPELEKIYIVDCSTWERIVPNTVPFVIDNDLMTGKIMVMLRTSDASGPPSILPPGPFSAQQEAVTEYFRTKQRRFEFQFEVRFKKVPEGPLFLGIDFNHFVKFGMVQRSFLSACLNFVRKLNKGFHANMNGTAEPSEADLVSGRYEKPLFISFPATTSMDCLVATKPGDPIPVLGEAIPEDPESVRRRKRGGRVDWNTEDTYSMSFYSAYLDFLTWQVLNFPGIRPFSLASVGGTQPMNISMYVLKNTPSDGSDSRHHFVRDQDVAMNFEICHTGYMSLGPAAKRSDAVMEYQPSLLPESETFDDGDDEIDEDDVHDEDDAETLDELAEGMYLQSGNIILLREFSASMDHKQESFVANGGGFAVLQRQTSSFVMIEKARSNALDDSSRSRLIKSGDIVTIKLVTPKDGQEGRSDIKYLSLHRGWWLKWVSTMPKHNGYFRIESGVDSELEAALWKSPSSRLLGAEIPFIELGRPFSLHHKRWSRFQVGLSFDSSARFGGRMLGLHKKLSSFVDDDNDPVDEMDDQPQNDPFDQNEVISGKGKKELMRPARFCAESPPTTEQSFFDANIVVRDGLPSFRYKLDAPAWIEMTHRTNRQRQRAYVVRVMKQVTDFSGSAPQFSIRLKTGRDLAPVLQFGLRRTKSALSKDHVEISDDTNESIPLLYGTISDAVTSTAADARISIGHRSDPETSPSRNRSPPSRHLNARQIKAEELLSNLAFDNGTAHTPQPHKRSLSADSVSQLNEFHVQITQSRSEEIESEEDDIADSEGEYDELLPTAYSSLRRKNNRWIKKSAVKMAKTVKTGTNKLGKNTVTAGKAAGRAIMAAPISAPKQPSRQPRRLKNRRKTVQDHHIAVNKAVNRSLRHSRSKVEQKLIAGQLCAPDASCKTVSHILEEISSIAEAGTDAITLNLVQSQAESSSELQSWFLRGDSIELGIAPAKTNDNVLADVVVARCMWESHWREEWCALYPSRIEFYAPFTKKPSNALSLDDVQSVRHIQPEGSANPLPGFPIIVIETVCRCHYLAFLDDASRKDFDTAIKVAVFNSKSGDRKSDISSAYLWQSLSSHDVVSSGRGKWATVSSSKKRKHRIVLNRRRMIFDVDPFISGMQDEDTDGEGVGNATTFVESLLLKACSFSLESLEKSPKDFIDFLDATSRLMAIPLEKLDLTGKEAFCFFLNLYHCLLQHSLLLTVNGLPNKKTLGHFKRTSCYEIGGDVFSLAELECYVLRGNMGNASNARPPYVLAPKASRGYLVYALGCTDPRLNFALNNGDVSCPPRVTVFHPDLLDEQLRDSASAFLARQVEVDVARRTITLPKVCEIYRRDFGSGDGYDCISFCLQYLDDDTQDAIIDLFVDETNSPRVQYRSSEQEFWSNLLVKV